MAHVKAHEVDGYLQRPDQRHVVVLVYGPDIGLVAERVDALAATSGVDLSDPFSHIRMDGEAMESASAVAEEAHTISMFGGKRLIRFRPGSMRNPADAIKPLDAQPPEDALVIIQAGDLNKGNALRKLVENMAHGIALPCYQDEGRALDRVIDQELQAASLTMDPAARNHLKSLLGGDRLASRGEVQKLCLYAHGKGTISVEDINAVVGDVAASAVDDIVDAAGLGNLPKLETEFTRFAGLGTPYYLLLNAALRQFHLLHSLRVTHEDGGGNVRDLVSRARPPIYFKRRDAVMQMVNRWNAEALLSACERIQNAIRDSRIQADMEPAIVRSCLTALALMARRRR